MVENTLNNGEPISPFVLYLMYTLLALLLINMVCCAYYFCSRVNKAHRHKYKVVSVESTDFDTDIENK